ncbi:MAG: c-type cytochrome [Acidobacteria bacterium]|nr:c-type cytochrome [Acidobacteriota bacterium]
MRALWALLLGSVCGAQTLDLRAPAVIEQGAAAFAKSCAVGYCHGSEGRSARGPELRGRRYEPKALFGMIHDGLPGTSMPAWKGILPNEEIWAITGYIASLGSAPVAESQTVVDLSQAASEPARRLSAEARRGRELFFDLNRQKRCGLCHALEGRGRAVGPNLAATLEGRSAAEIRRAIDDPHASIAFGYAETELVTADGETIVGVRTEEPTDVVRIYDFGALPPPLRSFAPEQVRRVRRLERSPMPGGWTAVYSEDEIAAIVAYLDAEN